MLRQLYSLLSPGGRQNRLTILIFHRVVECSDPLLPDEPDAAEFSAMLAWLKEFARVLPLSDAVDLLRAGCLPPRSVAITFDDGYANNLSVAAPLLEKFGLPATIFVAVDAIETGYMWNDLVIEAVRGLNGRIDLRALDLDEHCISQANRSAVVDLLLQRLKYRPLAERKDAALELYGLAHDAHVPRLMMTPDDLGKLPAELIHLGAHTMSHPILAGLDDDASRDEIGRSRQWLAECTGRLPALFAYPNGRPNQDYQIRHAEMARTLGFKAAVSTHWGVATRRSSLFELPRIAPWEREAGAFKARLLKEGLRSWLPGQDGRATC